jgi:hypothetical protein
MVLVSRLAGEWVDPHARGVLEADARADILAAIRAYSEKLAQRDGRQLTARAAFGLLGGSANRWFGGDQGALARWAGIHGPVTTRVTPTLRATLPDIRAVVAEVAELLVGDVEMRGSTRQRRGEMAADAVTVLEYWLATGRAPSRPVGARAHLLAEAHPAGRDAAYRDLLAATVQVLRRRGHPAAADLA